MPVWPGFGVNYKSRNPVVIAQDIAYFKSIGLKNIRINIPAFANGTWSPATYATWRNVAKIFHDEGFDVLGGIAWGLVNPTEWPSFREHCILEAEYVASINAYDEFNMGNEMELHLTNMTTAQLRNNLRSLSTDMHNVFRGGKRKIMYTFACYGSDVDDWIAEGKGDMDVLGGNLYGNFGLFSGAYTPRNYLLNIPKMKAAFGSNFWITEFNSDAEIAKFKRMDELGRLNDTLAAMYTYIKSQGAERAYLYQYRSYDDKDNNDTFFLRSSDGKFNTAWNTFLEGRRSLVK
jgi:hypothetical protein